MARVPESSRVRSVGIAALDGQARGTAQRAGQAIEETGRATQRAIEAATKFGTNLRRRRQQAEDGGFTSSVTTKARSRFQEVFLESRNQATEGAEDFAASFQKRLDQETEDLIEAARAAGGRPSTRAIQDTRNRLQLLGAAFTGQAASFENNARIAKLSRDLAGGLGDLTRQVFDDPERRPELLDAADEGIDAAASFLPATELETLRAGARAGITLASVNGVIERDPELAAEMLEAGDFDEGLDTGRKAALIGGAKTAIRLEKESAARELAADRRELKRDAEAAIAKLRGGQPVAELGALESRAETLADSDTGAALRHAEDDRFFMRGFAQRSPAAQADLIAAVENGPELKPVETRRLAAMQAQAAVTERALAKDPLAYAQSTGVIDEPTDITDLSPEALRARLRQAETAAEQFGLPSAPLLRPGEAEKIADKIATGTPEELQAKAEELADLPAEIRQVIVEEIGPRLPLDALRVLDLMADSEPEQDSSAPIESVSLPPMDLSGGADSADEDELGRQAVAAALQGAPLETLQQRLRELGLDPAEFGAVPDAREFDQLFATEGPEGQARVFGTRAGTLEDLGLFGKRRSAITRADTLRGVGPDNAFRDLVPAEGEPGDNAVQFADNESERSVEDSGQAVPKRKATVSVATESFPSANDAVIAAYERYDDLYFSLSGGKELTGAIVEANGKFFLTTPTVGPGISDINLRIIGEPKGSRVVGVFHTHPPGAIQNEFSIRDREFVREKGIPMFLRNGAGEVRVLSGKGQNVGGISGIDVCPGGGACLTPHPDVK